MSAANRAVVAVGSVIGGLIGAVIGQAVGVTLAVPSHHNPNTVRPMSKRELEFESTGGVVGAILGSTIIAILEAETHSAPPTAGVGRLPSVRGFP